MVLLYRNVRERVLADHRRFYKVAMIRGFLIDAYKPTNQMTILVMSTEASTMQLRRSVHFPATKKFWKDFLFEVSCF